MDISRSHFLVLTKTLICLCQLYIHFQFSISIAQSTNYPAWIKTESPVFSDLNNLTLFTSQTGVCAGKQILILEDNNWVKMKTQPPMDVDRLFANSLESIFVSSKTEYQESELFYWDGIEWENIYHPLANSIQTMWFKDRNNGVIAGLGEVAVLKNNTWEFLPPPTNNLIVDVHVESDSTIWTLSLISSGLFKYNGKWKQIINSEKVFAMQLFRNNLFVFGTNFLGKVVADSIQFISFHDDLYQNPFFSVLNDSSIIAVGNNGIILKYANNKWSQIKSPVNSNLKSIKMLNNNEGWCVGEDATILHLTNKLNSSTGTNIWQGFDKVTFHQHAKVVDDEYGVVTADFNNDGLVDIFTCGLYERNHLYMNDGMNYGVNYGLNYGRYNFSDEAEERGVSGYSENDKEFREFNLGACAADFDKDNNIDLYVSSLNGTNKFYKNIGGGQFVDYTSVANVGGERTDRTNSIITADVDNDGDLDLYLTNENATNRLLLNNGAGIFSEVTSKVGLLSEFGGTSCSFADIDNDGDQDLYVANWSAENKLYKNLLIETSKLTFKDISDDAKVGGKNYTKSNGVVFSDIDNDADLDLFVTNRKSSNRLYINNGDGIFSDKTEELIGLDSTKSYGVVIKDFDGDSFKDIYIANVGENLFLKNINGRKFVNNTSNFNADISGYSTGTASADFDNDGDLDIYLANYIGESSAILVNKKNSKNNIVVNITGVSINTSGIGTKIYAYKSGNLDNISHLVYYSEVSGGSGYGSMNERKIIIPTQNNCEVDLKIVFPSKKVQKYKNIKATTILNISDEVGIKKYLILARQYIYRLFFDGHNLFNLIKWCIALSLILLSILWTQKKYNWVPKIIIWSSILIAINYYLLSSVFEYKNFIYSTILPLGGTVTLLSVFHLFYDKIMLRKKVETEKKKLQEKISRDLHDDLASTLGSISIYLELLKQAIQSKSENVWMFFNKSNNLLSNAKQTITDLIWTIKPNPELITNFAARIRENFNDIFRERKIKFSVIVENISNSTMLSSVEKHNIYLIVKEALNNIIKHAEATEVTITFTKIKEKLNIKIYDNGIGFAYQYKRKRGNGLTNMNTRMEEIDGDFIVNSELGKGTKILISF